VANPQPTDAHLRIAHKISEQLMVSHFTEQQRRILDLILRLSWGCNKQDANIPHQSDFSLVGVRQGHIKSHLDWLQEAKVIFRSGNTYSFNKDFDQWRVSRALAFTTAKLTELVTLNLNHNAVKLRKTEPTRYGKRNLPVTENGTGPDTKSDTPKERLKKVVKETTTSSSSSSNQTLEEYFVTLKDRFGDTDVDFDFELEKFWLYWGEGNRKLKSPKLALVNWMKKAMEHKKGGEYGKTGRDSRARRLPQSYETPEEFDRRTGYGKRWDGNPTIPGKT